MATIPLPLDEELTPSLEGWRALLLLLLLFEPAADDDDDDCVVELVEVDAVPGMVAAPTAANTPTAARAAAPAQKVRRLRSWIAASRASILLVSMSVSVCNVAGLELGTA